MPKKEAPPFGRGETFGTTTDGEGLEWLGREFEFEDNYYDSNKPGKRTQHTVTCRVVQNDSAGALLPGYLVTFQAGSNNSIVDGKTTTTGANGVVVDEWLPAAGVAQYDLFYVVIRGPSSVYTSLAGDGENVIDEDDILIALTGATSGATTSGRVIQQVLTAKTTELDTDLALQFNGAFARALSAKTTTQTNNTILAYISNRWL